MNLWLLGPAFDGAAASGCALGDLNGMAGGRGASLPVPVQRACRRKRSGAWTNGCGGAARPTAHARRSATDPARGRSPPAGLRRLVATSDAASGMVMALNAPPQNPAQPLARQLPDLARDALFRDCLDVARSMARAPPPGSDLLPAISTPLTTARVHRPNRPYSGTPYRIWRFFLTNLPAKGKVAPIWARRRKLDWKLRDLEQEGETG